jgi:hypothetical protein
MRGFFRLVVLIAVSALIAAALVFYTSSTPNFRDCVALMWDRKHPEEVKRRQEEANFNRCEADRLREGLNCDCKAAEGQPGYCDDYMPSPGTPEAGARRTNPREALSLDELRRADAEAASRTSPP